MNQLVLKRTIVFSLLLGSFIALFSLIPQLIALGCFALAFLASVIVILFMKRNKRYLSYITIEQGAILGAVAGFFSTIGFFAVFCPLVCVIHLIFKAYYPYAIPYVLTSAIWLFLVVVIVVALIFAATNATSAMTLTWVLGNFEKKPKDYDARIDIKIDD